MDNKRSAGGLLLLGLILAIAGTYTFSFIPNQKTISGIVIQVSIPLLVVGLSAMYILYNKKTSFMQSVIVPMSTIGIMYVIIRTLDIGIDVYHWRVLLPGNGFFEWLILPVAISLAFQFGLADSKRSQWISALFIGVTLLSLIATIIQSIYLYDPIITTRYLYPSIFKTGYGLIAAIPIFSLGASIRNSQSDQQASLVPLISVAIAICIIQILAIALAVRLHLPPLSDAGSAIFIVISLGPVIYIIGRKESRSQIISTFNSRRL